MNNVPGNGDLGGLRQNLNNTALDIKFLGQNVNGLNEKVKRKTIFEFVKSKAAIIFLQETHSTELTEPSWRQ